MSDRFPGPGDRMKFMNRNGYDHERDAAAKVFNTADTLTVKRCEVGNWSHSLWFEEAPERGWNGVMFEFIDRPERYPLPASQQAGQAIEQAYPFGYRSEDKEP